jgi:hypothetical protein
MLCLIRKESTTNISCSVYPKNTKCVLICMRCVHIVLVCIVITACIALRVTACCVAVNTECFMFRPSQAPPPIPEDWAASVWEDPWAGISTVDPRSQYLDQQSENDLQDLDFALDRDRGANAWGVCTYSGQARSFGSPGHHWGSSDGTTSPQINK